MSTIERRTVMFAALDGEIALADEIGAAGARAQLQQCQARLSALIDQNDGEIHEIIGGDILCLFDSPDAAVNAACQMAQWVRLSETDEAAAFRLRIGFHHGIVYRRGDDIFGDCVNTASRVLQQAARGEVLTTGQAEEMHARTRELVRAFDRVEVKGKAEPLRLYEIRWRPADLGRTTIAQRMIDTGYLRNLSADRLTLTCADREIDILPAMTPLTIGRDPRADIVLVSDAASRNHARIDHRRGKFLLVDASTNGTHVRRSDGSRIHLRREHAVLTGSGEFCLGLPVGETDAALVHYQVHSVSKP